MVRNRFAEFAVGLLMIAGLLALLVLAFKVSGLTTLEQGDTYILTADFDTVGSLKVRAPVSIGGVTIGRVTNVVLDPNTFRAKVTLRIDEKYNQIPTDTAASILTEGLLGSNYIGLTPGVEPDVLKPNAEIETTHSALILENLIGQFLFSLKSNDSKK